MELKDLVGEHDFTFVPKMDVRHPIDENSNGVMFGLDKHIYLVFEDPSDGYRSNAGPLLSFEGSPTALGGWDSGWSPDYLRNQRVLCVHDTQGKYGGENDVLSIRSIATGREIMRVGTTNVDDYYPGFVVEWVPGNLDANVRR